MTQTLVTTAFLVRNPYQFYSEIHKRALCEKSEDANLNYLHKITYEYFIHSLLNI